MLHGSRTYPDTLPTRPPSGTTGYNDDVSTALVWFRRDLRLSDHPALVSAIDTADEVIPVFVLEPALWEAAGDNRRWFLHGCLEALDADLRSFGSRLVVRRGDPARELLEVARDAGADAVFATGESTPRARSQEAAVRRALAVEGASLILDGTSYVVPPGSLRTKGGTPFKVFTPFRRAWWAHPHPIPIARPRRITTPDVPSGHRLPPRPATVADLPEPGESAAHRRLDTFLDRHAGSYADERDRPDLDRTSRLSAALHFGCLHPREILVRLDPADPGHATFASELCWREFYAGVLAEWPASAWRSWRADAATVEVDRGPEADERFAAWTRGRTGYPFVDAGMRQLAGEGFVHNRVRMVVASFLVKDLHIDWTRGARHFLDHLVDGDVASNNHGWQWVAGTGTDASPYHRVFNPVSQGRRFDPEGDYVRRWVPELASLTGAAAHEPWAVDPPPTAYPARIVDHAEERDEALRRWKARGD